MRHRSAGSALPNRGFLSKDTRKGLRFKGEGAHNTPWLRSSRVLNLLPGRTKMLHGRSWRMEALATSPNLLHCFRLTPSFHVACFGTPLVAGVTVVGST